MQEGKNTIPRSAYESYSAFANTKSGHIVLGVYEDKKKKAPEERFIIQGIENPARQLEDFWNTINGNKVNVNILKDEDVFIIEENNVSLIVIHVPRADYKQRPVYVGENPYKGTYKTLQIYWQNWQNRQNRQKTCLIAINKFYQ